MSPSARTLAQLKKYGIPACVVERWVAPAQKRIDMFGFADIVAIYPDGITAIQVTSGSNHSKHKIKILENDKAPMWLERGGLISLWSWSKKKLKRGGKAVRWVPRIEDITKEDFLNV